MRKKKVLVNLVGILTVIITIAIVIVVPHNATANPTTNCELDRPINFADLNWDSSRFHVAVASFIVEHGFGCKTKTIPGSTIPLITGMIKGDIDIMMEVWKENITETWDKGEKSGKIKMLAINFPDAIQGWFIPKYLVEGENAPAKGLRSVADLPKYKKLFRDPEDPRRGRFYNCIYGWVCEQINTRKLKAYKLDKHFNSFHPGTAAALSAAIAAAYKRKKPILYAYWGPSWVMAKFDGILLQEPPHDPVIWEKLRTTKNPKQACAYPESEVYTGVNTSFSKKAPQIIAFLREYRTTNKLVSHALAYLEDNKDATPKDAAIKFLRENKTLWQNWLPEQATSKVNAALKKL